VADGVDCARVAERGARLATFRFEPQADGAVLRMGAGKFTVDLGNPADPAVRYWHPEREFKWSRRGGWRFKTPVAEKPFDSSDRGTSWSDTSSSSDTSRTVATAAAVAGLGGTFDGGGASAGWDGAASPGDGAEAPSATAAGDADSGGDGSGDSGSDSGSDSSSTSY
jgi:hypothetical protein